MNMDRNAGLTQLPLPGMPVLSPEQQETLSQITFGDDAPAVDFEPVDIPPDWPFLDPLAARMGASKLSFGGYWWVIQDCKLVLTPGYVSHLWVHSDGRWQHITQTHAMTIAESWRAARKIAAELVAANQVPVATHS